MKLIHARHVWYRDGSKSTTVTHSEISEGERMKKITLGNFLTDAEINLATKIFVEDRDNLHKRLLAEIIEPNMERINASLGQQNNAAYLAYGVEYVLTQAEIKR